MITPAQRKSLERMKRNNTPDWYAVVFDDDTLQLRHRSGISSIVELHQCGQE